MTGIILAAGASRRMGSPKALLEYQGETFLGRLVRVMSLACDPVIVTLGYHAESLRPRVPASARIAINPDPERGQLSSLQTALEMFPQDSAGFAFIPVDCPAVAEATVIALAEAFERRAPSTRFVIPRRPDQSKPGGYRRGHPVLATRQVAAELLALPPTGEARTIVHAHVDRTEYLEVADPGIFADIDTPEAYQRLLAGIQETRA